MTTPIKLAVRHKLEHPDESYSKVAKRFFVSKTTLHDHTTGTHATHEETTARRLSMQQELEFVAKILD
jgi:hypothetical protein